MSDHPEYFVFLSEAALRANWWHIKNSSDNPRPDLKRVDQFLKEARLGNVYILGAQLRIQDKLPNV